jgi:hypothetical protein
MVSSPSRTHLHLPLLTPHAVPSYSRMHEVKRLQAVRRYEVLATPPDVHLVMHPTRCSILVKGLRSLGLNNCCNTTFGIVTP